MIEGFELYQRIQKNMPAEVIDRMRWAPWGRTQNKKIYLTDDGTYARPDHPEDWAPRYNVLLPMTVQQRDRISGYGFLMNQDAGIGVIDIDRCIDYTIDREGYLSDTARQIIAELDSYTEYSPSHTGVHIIIGVPMGYQRNIEAYYEHGKSCEVYLPGCVRAITATGDPYGDRRPLRTLTAAELDRFMQTWMRRPEVAKPAADRPAEGSHLSDDEVLAMMARGKNGSRYMALYHGDMLGYRTDWLREDGTPDQHRYDAALVNILCYYCGGDEQQIDRLFRMSGLMRKKWDERWHGKPKGQLLIQKIKAICTTYYDPAWKNKK